MASYIFLTICGRVATWISCLGGEMGKQARGWVGFGAALWLCAGCDEEVTAPARTDCDVPVLFAQSCGGGACHDGAQPASALDLVSPGLEARVVMVSGTSCGGVLADPSDPVGSLLYDKLLAAPECGASMPLLAELFSEAERTCVRDWISGLLPPEGDTDEDCPDCECEPLAEESCYSGASGTAGVGQCLAGERTCGWDGLWGPCDGEVLPSPEQCATAADEDCDGATPACSELWSLAFGTARAQSVRSVGVDEDGFVYLFGDFEDPIDFGGGLLTPAGDKADLVLAKFDSLGNHVWSQRYGDSSNQYAGKLIVRDDALYLLGRAFGTVDFGSGVLDAAGTDDVFVAKLDLDGDPVWSRIFGGIDPDRSERMAVDEAGDVVVTGTFTGTVDLGSGPFVSRGERDAFVVKLDGAFGSHRFSRQIGSVGDDYGFGVSTDEDGDVYVAGRFVEEVRIGDETLTGFGGVDVYLARLTPQGGVVWAQVFGSVGDDPVHDLLVQEDEEGEEITLIGLAGGEIDLGGGPLVTAGARDLLLARFDLDGEHLWSQVLGDAADQFDTEFELNSWNTLAPGEHGELLVSGAFSGVLDFGGGATLASAGKVDMMVFRMDRDGGYLGGQRFGGIGTEMVLDGVDAGYGLAVVGGRFFSSSVSFGVAGSVSGAGSSDGVVVRVLP
jgi:hypothetical protein